MANTPSVILACTLGASIIYFSTKDHPQPPTPPQPKPSAPNTPTLHTPPASPEKEVALKDLKWPHKTSDIPLDRKATTGELPNGFRYVIYPNDTPKDAVAMRLHIDTGSLMENENQRGLAHFIEHMVFNGTKNYKAGELVPIMQRLGISFGAHMNAFTSFDQTVYMLDLPNQKNDTLQLGYTVMRDFADGALMAPEEIDKERGVILSEKRSRDSVQFRLLEKQLQAILPNSLIANRFPIGLENVIRDATQNLFLDYYHRFYTPKRMTLVIVSNLDPKEVEKRITAEFSSMQEPANPGKNPQLGSLPPLQGLKTHVFTDPEVASTNLTLSSITTFENLTDNSKNREKSIVRAINNAILSKRFERLAKKTNSPILGGNASSSDLFKFAQINQIDVNVTDQRWQEALPALENEFRRMIQFGVTDAELQESKANLLNAYKQALASQNTRESGNLASSIAETIQEKNVLSSPETDLNLVNTTLKNITPQICNQSFQNTWKNSGYHLILTSKNAPNNSEQQLNQIYQTASQQNLTAPEQQAPTTFAYTNFGPNGQAIATKSIDSLGIQQITFANNIRVNLKKTDFEKNSIRLRTSFGNGLLSLPRSQPGLQFLANTVINNSGVGKHDADELQRIFAGKTLNCQFTINDDRFAISSTTTPEDLTLQLQLLCAQISDPAFRENALADFRNSLPALEQQLKHTLAGSTSNLQAWLHNNDPRYLAPDVKQLAAYTLNDLKDWLTPEFSRSYLEVSIIGDFDLQAIVPLLSQTLGALPPRDATPQNFEAARKITMPNAPAAKQFTYSSQVPQGYAITLWKINTMRNNQHELRRLNVLTNVISNYLREEIREKLGASYSPAAMLDGSQNLDNFGYLMTFSTTKPDQVTNIQQVTRQIGDKLSKQGITQDDFQQAIQPVIETIKRSERENDYWLNTVMDDSQLEPSKIVLALDRNKDTLTINQTDISNLAKKYLNSDKAIEVNITSTPPPTSTTPPSPTPTTPPTTPKSTKNKR